MNAFQINKSGEIITTLIDEFKYPKYGPGMMWETAYEKLKEKGHEIKLSSRVKEIKKEEVAVHLEKIISEKSRKMANILAFAENHTNKSKVKSSFDDLEGWKSTKIYD